MILLVSRDQILNYWPEVSPLVDSALACSQGEFDKADILGFLIAQSMNLWVSIDGQVNGMAVTQVITYPRHKVMHIILLSGKDAFTGWFVDMLHTIEIWAKAVGCARITENGRRGWEKAGERFGRNADEHSGLGYKKVYITMSKNI